jgi:hypothetical protein
MYDKSLGGLWVNAQRTSKKSPHYLGSLKLKPKELRLLLDTAMIEGEAKINLAAWKGNSSRVFLTLEGQAPKGPNRPRHSWSEPTAESNYQDLQNFVQPQEEEDYL